MTAERHIREARNEKRELRDVFQFSVLACLLSLLPSIPSHASVPIPGRATSVSIGNLTFTGVFPRIFTPNGDGYNDKAAFHFENPEQLPVAGKVFDINGAEVASLEGGLDPTILLLWDGKDSRGQTVPGGIYLYRIDFQGKLITGTVVVAR